MVPAILGAMRASPMKLWLLAYPFRVLTAVPSIALVRGLRQSCERPSALLPTKKWRRGRCALCLSRCGTPRPTFNRAAVALPGRNTPWCSWQRFSLSLVCSCTVRGCCPGPWKCPCGAAVDAASTIMFTAQLQFFCTLSDPVLGGTYMYGWMSPSERPRHPLGARCLPGEKPSPLVPRAAHCLLL